jgi:hypothetical protein
MTTNFHNNAARLIVMAAEKSGLLQEIAQALHFADKTPWNMDCFACALRDELIEAFDDHTCLAGIVLEGFFGDGFDFQEASEEEIAPYLGVSSFSSTPSTQT